MKVNQRLHHLKAITLTKLRSLDRDKTVVLLPVGMVEVHGPHLPLGTDIYAVDSLTASAAAWLLDQDPTLHVLLLPTIPYGTDPIDTRREDLFADSGSVWIKAETLKVIVRDVLDEMIRYGFKYLFPVGFHGGQKQSVALAEVCADLQAAYPDRVIDEPIGYVLAGAEEDVSPGLATLLGRPLTTQEEVALKGSVHASMFETSMMLYMHPELVDPNYKNLRSVEWRQVYRDEDWPGYIGTGPAHADAQVGGAVLRWRGVRTGSLIKKAVDGVDLSEMPRHPSWEPDEIEPREMPPPKKHVERNPEMEISRADLIQADDTHPSGLSDTKPNAADDAS